MGLKGILWRYRWSVTALVNHQNLHVLYFRNTNISDSDKIKVLEDEIHNLQQKLRRYEDRGFLAKVWDLFK